MGVFYKKVILFLLFPILLFGTIEGLVRSIPNEYKFKFEKLNRTDTITEVLVAGNSFTYFGINPASITTKVFNASQINESPYINYAKFNTACQHYSNLKTVIVPVSFANLRFSKYPDTKLNLLKYYVIYTNYIQPISIFNYAEISSDNLTSNVKKIYNYYILHKPNIFCNNYGWGFFYYKNKSKDLLNTSNIRYQTTLRRIEIGNKENAFQTNRRLLETWASICAQKNIRLVFINMPVSNVMYNKIDSKMREEVNAFINQLVHKNKNCTYLNWIQSPQFNAGDFYDADHLNTIGAKKMSGLLDSFLLSNSPNDINYQ